MKVPFYTNSKDDNRCFQASLKMILGYFLPHQKYSDKFLNKISGYKKDRWTWNSQAILWLIKNNFSLVYITYFSYSDFAVDGEKYLRKFWTSEIFETQKKMGDLKRERILAKKLIKKIKPRQKKARVKDVCYLLRQNNLVMVSVNSRKINEKSGYCSHMVVATKCTKQFIIFHDPGLPPKKNRRKSHSKFQEAMFDILAIKKT